MPIEKFKHSLYRKNKVESAAFDGDATSVQIRFKVMPECPCCSEKLLRHVRHGKVYWFCTHCWQEMPNLEAIVGNNMVLTKERVSGAKVVLT